MYRQRTSEQALRVDRPPSALSFATCGSLPATQGQRWKDARKQSMQWLRPVSASKLMPRLLCVLTTQICFVRLLTLPSMPEWQ